MFDKIQKSYNEELVGKHFVYKSKYGSITFGVVDRVVVSSEVVMDDESNRKMKLSLMNKMGINPNPTDLQPINVKDSWTASRPKITIISKNNVPYCLDECTLYFR